MANSFLVSDQRMAARHIERRSLAVLPPPFHPGGNFFATPWKIWIGPDRLSDDPEKALWIIEIRVPHLDSYAVAGIRTPYIQKTEIPKYVAPLRTIAEVMNAVTELHDMWNPAA